MLGAQDFNSDPKIKEAKPFKMKLLKSDSEKTGTHERSSHFNSLFDGGGGSTKTMPQGPLKESSSSLDYPKNPAMQIPPIAHNLSAIASSMSVTSGIHSYRPEEKPKKYISPFKKHGQLSPASHYNLNVATSVANDKNLLQTSKKKWDFSRTDVRLPELSHSHLPELKGADIRNMKLLKKENRLASESRIPSLAALDLHNASMALQQISGNALQDASDANFPRVEH